MKRSVMGAGMAALVFGCATADNDGSADETSVSSTKSALTAAQCGYFAVGGKTRICHATGSSKNPYVILSVAETACAADHAGHAADYVSTDATCDGQGCLPDGAPSDPTSPCCEGLRAQNGTCRPAELCQGVTCNPSDQCHVSACDPATGRCVETPKSDGFSCDDGNACTQSDTCQAGTCVGTDSVVCTGRVHVTLFAGFGSVVDSATRPASGTSYIDCPGTCLAELVPAGRRWFHAIRSDIYDQVIWGEGCLEGSGVDSWCLRDVTAGETTSVTVTITAGTFYEGGGYIGCHGSGWQPCVPPGPDD